MAPRFSTINLPIVLRVIGWLVVMEGLFMCLPLATALWYGDGDTASFAWGIAACLTCGSLMAWRIRPRRRDMGKREGFLLTALVWVVFSAFGTIPFYLSDTMPFTLSASYFEAMSGFTTTGATVIEDVEQLSRSILLWRCEMNWIGGMGIILFTLAVIPMLNHLGGMQMFNAEVTGITHDKLRPRISQTAKNLWAIYIILTAALLALLWAGPMSFYDSLCHAMTTISTGGFSTRSGSIGAYNSVYVDLIITLFMFLGGVNFALMYRMWQRDFSAVRRNDVFMTFLRLIAIFYLLIVASILIRGQYDGWRSITVDPLFLVLSTMTSTGYTVNNFEMWGSFILSLVFLMMFFGACAGSTCGGAKLDRMLFLVKNLRNEIYRTIHPNAILAVRVNGKVMSHELVSKVIAFLCLYVLVIVIAGAILTAMGIPLIDAFFSTFSCIGNTGLGAGITGYGGGYDLIPDAGKWVLSLVMLTGRLEVFTILILLTPGFWRK